MDPLHRRILEQFRLYPGKQLTPGNVIILLRDTTYTDEQIVAGYELLLEMGYLKDDPINGVHHATLAPTNGATHAGSAT